MATPVFKTEAGKAGNYPQFRFNQRERKLLKSIEVGFPYSAIAAGSFTTVGGSANETITIAGALSSDFAVVVLKTKGGTPRTILTSAAAAGQINVVMSGDASTDHVLTYLLFRAS